MPEVSEIDVLVRIHDAAGASVEDSFAMLDLADQDWSVRLDATWIVASTRRRRQRREHPRSPWCASGSRSWRGAAAAGDAAGTLPAGLRRAAGVTVLGREGGGGFTDGALVHSTEIGGTAVVGMWNAFGDWGAVTDAVSSRHPGAWIVGCEHGTRLDAALAAGFTAAGPLRIWRR
ncbi:MAG: hypothetical protein U0W40_18550 [Acidimicrobiia bacterium]